MANFTAVKELADAKVFPNHRSLIAAVVELLNAGRIKAYSIHSNGQGVSAGVSAEGDWGYLA